MNRQPQLDFYEMGAGVKAFSSTRHGGWSKGNYAAFNINRYCGDEEENIRLNRLELCQMLGINDDHLVMPHQVHETKVAQIDGRFLAMNAGKRKEELEGVDALMTNLSGVCIGVSTADCIPVLLYDQEKKAICAIHAGWRGTVKRIVMKAIETMTEAYGTQPQQLVAQIGPGIHLESFEVGDEVYDAFAQDGFDMAAIARRFPANDGMGKKWHIDLPACNRLQLMDSGVNPQNITVSSVCTFQQATDYFSARRLGIDSGRIFSGILLKENR
jgi:hypothetical protein